MEKFEELKPGEKQLSIKSFNYCEIQCDDCTIYRGSKIAILFAQDEFSDSPRGNSNLGKMFMYEHRSYDLPKEIDQDGLENAFVRLPVYMYDHSGVCFSTKPFNDPWDSSQCGFICASEEDIKKWFEVDTITDEVIKKVHDVLKAEVDEYSAYASGDVYQYAIYEIEDDTEDNEIDCCPVLDSCCGYYSFDECREAALDAVKEYI